MYAISLGDDGAELRPLEPWHAEEFLAHLERGREFINQYVPFGSKATDVATARAALQRYADMRAADTGSLHGLWLDGRLVGGVLFLNFDAADANCEVGCWLEPMRHRTRAGHPGHAGADRLRGGAARHPAGRVDRLRGEHAQPGRGPAAGNDPRRRPCGSRTPIVGCGTTSRCGPCSPRSGATHARAALTTIIKGPLRERPYGARYGNQDC